MITLTQMKVTTQRTNKSSKVLMFLGIVGVVVGVYGLMADANWSLIALLGGGLVWSIGKVSSWFLNE